MSPTTRKWLMRLVKLGVCAGALWYLAGKVSFRDYARLADEPARAWRIVADDGRTLDLLDPVTGSTRRAAHGELADPAALKKGQRPVERGLISIVRRCEWRWTPWALAALGPIPFILAWRLRYLLAMQHIALSYRDAVLLTFAGNFFNFAMPGTTGGDVYKAYHIAKRTHRRVEGVTVVLIDRVMGLVSFLLLAGLALALSRRRQIVGEFGQWVLYLVIAFFVGSALYFSSRLRRLIRFEALLARLPFGAHVRRIDETALEFRRHPRQTAVALLGTVVSHFFGVAAIYMLARGFGIAPRPDDQPGDFALAVLSATVVGYLLAAVPISFQGFGLMEAVYLRVLVNGGWATASQMLTLTLSSRVAQIIWALPGIVVPWLGLEPPPRDETMRDVQDGADDEAA